MFTPANLTNEQRSEAMKAMRGCLRGFMEADIGPEETAACLMSAAWYAVTRKARSDEAADFLKNMIDEMAAGLPRQH